jgi:hypothetical protein
MMQSIAASASYSEAVRENARNVIENLQEKA